MINYSGISESRVAPVAGETAKKKDQSIILVSSDVRARRLASDLSFFVKDREIMVLPSADHYFMRYEAKSHDDMLERLRVLKALQSGEKVIVISGGYDKHIPYAPLGELFLRKVKFAVLCGATAPKIKEALDSVGFDAYIVVDDFEKAVLEAKKAASDGDNVVLTPASASFDMFKNFMERGKAFKNLVAAL